jgi:hypothetical protein
MIIMEMINDEFFLENKVPRVIVMGDRARQR